MCPKSFWAENSTEGAVYLNDIIKIFYSEDDQKRLAFSKTLLHGDIKKKKVFVNCPVGNVLSLP